MIPSLILAPKGGKSYKLIGRTIIEDPIESALKKKRKTNKVLSKVNRLASILNSIPEVKEFIPSEKFEHIEVLAKQNATITKISKNAKVSEDTAKIATTFLNSLGYVIHFTKGGKIYYARTKLGSFALQYLNKNDIHYVIPFLSTAFFFPTKVLLVYLSLIHI